jgi:hypothetical protein
LVDALNKSPEITAVSLAEVYTNGERVQDIEWIRDCGREGWIALTQNFRIAHVPHEIDAIEEFRTKVFSLTRADLPAVEQGLVFGRNLLRVIRRDRRDAGCFWRIHFEKSIKDIA